MLVSMLQRISTIAVSWDQKPISSIRYLLFRMNDGAGNLERWNFYAANLDPFRIPFASEYQQPFNPDKTYLRNDPYDNQNGEAEYEDGGLISQDYITRSTMISIKKL